MSVTIQPAPHIRCKGRVSLMPTFKKIFRGALFAIIMGVPTIYTVQQGGGVNSVFLVSLFLVGSLLVFGVDIEKVELGKLTIWFSEAPESYEKVERVHEERENGNE